MVNRELLQQRALGRDVIDDFVGAVASPQALELAPAAIHHREHGRLHVDLGFPVAVLVGLARHPRPHVHVPPRRGAQRCLSPVLADQRHRPHPVLQGQPIEHLRQRFPRQSCPRPFLGHHHHQFVVVPPPWTAFHRHRWRPRLQQQLCSPNVSGIRCLLGAALLSSGLSSSSSSSSGPHEPEQFRDGENLHVARPGIPPEFLSNHSSRSNIRSAAATTSAYLQPRNSPIHPIAARCTNSRHKHILNFGASSHLTASLAGGATDST
ncbi:hypothetical protein MARPO_0129s0054 [Marchantia polymorpha]|uniref:Uncharacterized protein n=1 Tax=Marchantia polymorpha TaxID=3197 RepID=A0A2R6W8I6_MARPO|nr:hypothetical protein MARPO_0129s0054 [Marchantia polymorpha]|eukprot:PTQ30176.1 hypothetical protein MARPO_0129s0054 [Marchantia polymorpha]